MLIAVHGRVTCRCVLGDDEGFLGLGHGPQDVGQAGGRGQGVRVAPPVQALASFVDAPGEFERVVVGTHPALRD